MDNFDGDDLYVNRYHKYKENHVAKFGKVNVSTSPLCQMWFDGDGDGFQSMYDPTDLDKIYLYYFYPLFLFLHYLTHLKKILFIGLGGGHLPLMLRKHDPHLMIDIVEIEKNVVLGAQHMGFKVDKNMDIYLYDGIAYFRSNRKQYDCIV